VTRSLVAGHFGPQLRLIQHHQRGTSGCAVAHREARIDDSCELVPGRAERKCCLQAASNPVPPISTVLLSEAEADHTALLG
jgi:hypothetical protein